MPSKCFSFTATKNQCLKSSFSSRGLRSTFTDLKDGTIMHCWVPKSRKTTRPDLILIHGFGANSMWQWADTVRILSTHFNVYVPDLVFFGDSFTTRPERTESFQAECVKRVMEANSVTKMSVVGLSYGGFVAYAMAAQFRDCIEKVVICCAGVCLEEKDLKEGLFAVSSVEDAANILLPQTAEKMRELMGYTFVKAPAKVLPSCLLTDFIDEMFTQYVEEKKELLLAIAKDRKLSDLPKITQPTLIVWGDQDKIFPLELGHRLKRFISPTGNLGSSWLLELPASAASSKLASLIIEAAILSSSGRLAASSASSVILLYHS
ncbi:putative 5'-adenylylsulfate reductase-like 4-like isoform 1 [Capsicum annuum]|nr:putative 5'-adenylylsulfate reductase-like 4-like isoform 1 [Capsicum annuum]